MSGSVKERLEAVLKKIAEAEKRSGRKSGVVDLIAVSKTFEADDIVPVLQAGHRIFGENRVQESQKKWPRLREEFDDIELHLIGPLQSNKAADAVALFDVIETVDRDKIARALAKEIKDQSKAVRCFVQVNTGEEPQKAGIAPRDTHMFVEKCRVDYGLNVVGLMCIPPADENPGPHFALLRKLAKQVGVDQLSMGMSGDYETAIELGATQVRVGSAIFGSRGQALVGA